MPRSRVQRTSVHLEQPGQKSLDVLRAQRLMVHSSQNLDQEI